MLGRVRYAMSAAISAWSAWDRTATANDRNAMYELLWALSDGTAFNAAWQRRGPLRDHRVYRNMRLLHKHTGAISDFYASKIYMGDLPVNGRVLADGTPGAIPIEPYTGDNQQDEAIHNAAAELWRRWNWQQGMRTRPRYVATLGDGLTELIDDPSRNIVWPQFVWPGYVVDLDLDQVDNVKAYAVEYVATIERNGRTETGRYRKEVDKQAFRYYWDDRPWIDPDGHGDAEQPNPYGFVPAIWDRFRHMPNSERGYSMFASTLQSVLEINSILSHSLDYQRKAFGAPVLLKGTSGQKRRSVVGPDRSEDPARLAESLNILEVDETASIEQVQFDIGRTLDQLELIISGIKEENPEASFYHQLRSMSNLTGPAVRMALGDVITRVEDARAAMDPQTVKLHQMAIAMCGERLRNGDWEDVQERDRVFASFDIDSYGKGELNFGIAGRDVIPDTIEDKLRELGLREALRYADSFEELGMDEAGAEALIRAREEAELRRANIY